MLEHAIPILKRSFERAVNAPGAAGKSRARKHKAAKKVQGTVKKNISSITFLKKGIYTKIRRSAHPELSITIRKLERVGKFDALFVRRGGILLGVIGS